MRIIAFAEVVFMLLSFVTGCMPQKTIPQSGSPVVATDTGIRQIALGEYVNLVAFSPNGRLFAAGSVKNNIRLWNTKDWETFGNLPHPDLVTDLVFSPSSNIIATVTNELAGGGRTNASIWFWNSTTGKNISAFKENTSRQAGITAIAYSPDGKLMAVGFGSGLVKMLSVEDPESIRVENEKVLSFDSGISFVHFSPDGRLLSVSTGSGISGPRDSRTLKIVEIQTGREIFSDRRISVYGLSFSPDGKTLAVAGNRLMSGEPRLTLVFFETNRWRQVREVKDSLVGEGLEFSSDGKTLIFALPGSLNSVISIWDVKGMRLAKSIEVKDTVTSLALAPDGKTIAVGSEKGKIHIY